jgi:nitrogen regulatory protein P-II 1
MQKIEAIVRPEKADDVKNALTAAGVTGLNVVHVTGRGVQRGVVHVGRGGESYEVDMLPKTKIEVVVPDDKVSALVDVICQAAQTGRIGDGKIFVIPVSDVIRVRTKERGEAAL